MKVKKYVISIICLTMLFTGCSNQSDQNDGSNDKNIQISDENKKPNYKEDYKLTYSNLLDEEIQREVSEKLEKAGIKKEYILDFMAKVNDYNEMMNGMKGLSNEFISVESSQPEYDELHGIDTWEELEYGYEDFNCRLTGFNLFKDYIKSDTIYTGETLNLMVDLDTVENNPESKFSKDDTEKFINLYAAVKTKDNYTKEERIKTIEEELKNRGIEFKENDKVSIINVYLDDYEFNELFIGHTGILIEDDEELIFVEKYAPLLPYQISKFKDRKELHSYLMDRLDRDTTGNGVAPMVFENGSEMKY